MPRVSAEAGNVLALQLGVNVTQMFAEIVGLGTVIISVSFYGLYISYRKGINQWTVC